MINGMKRISKAQEVALRKMFGKQWDCSYGWRVSLGTLRALVVRGLVEERYGEKLGAMAFPRTSIEYRVVQHNPEFVLKMAGVKP